MMKGGNMNRNTIALLQLIVLAALAASIALADPVAPLSRTVGESTTRDTSTLPTQQVSAIAGNVTELTLTAISVTKSWQGYYGNVSGTIGLWDASNNTFYNWSGTSTLGEVYATRVANPTWSGTACADGAAIAAEETALNHSATDADSVSNTFSAANDHPEFDVGATTIGANNCSATNAFDSTGAQTTDFFQVLLTDGASNIVYTTIMDGGATGFNGATYDFELLVGEDGHGNSATTPYYFWVELG